MKQFRLHQQCQGPPVLQIQVGDILGYMQDAILLCVLKKQSFTTTAFYY